MEYSLLSRDVEAELLPAATHHGIGLLAWAPLGRGVLTGKYADGTPADSRAASPALAPYVEAPPQRAVGAHRVRPCSPRPTGWAPRRSPSRSPGCATGPVSRPAVVGARDAAQLAASMATESVTLPAEISAALDDVSSRRCRSGDSTPVRLGGIPPAFTDGGIRSRHCVGGEPVQRGGPTGTVEGDAVEES